MHFTFLAAATVVCLEEMNKDKTDKAKRHHPEAGWLYGLARNFPMDLSSCEAYNELSLTTVENVKKKKMLFGSSAVD